MNAGKYIYAKLSATSAVTSLVGGRIYPVFIAQEAALPAIAYTVDNRPTDAMKDKKADHDTSIVTFSFWADASQGQDAYQTIEDIDAAVRTALDFVTGTAGGVTVEACKYLSSVDGMDADSMTLSRTATYQFITRN